MCVQKMNSLNSISKMAVINYAQMLYEDSSDEENVLEKIQNYAECTVPNMTDRQFQMHFRMTVETFEDLLKKMHSVYHENNYKHVGYPRTKIEKEVMITIWYLGNMESLRSVADRFGISKSTCWDVLYRTCNILLIMNKTFRIISWPNRERQSEISECLKKNGLRGVIGAIDGSHIRITAPKNYPNSYINRKNYYSVLLQGVCDHELLFTDVYAGQPGSLHDYTMYKKSDLYESISRGETVFYNNNYIVGDLAYKLSLNLLVGYKNTGNLTIRQKNFNIILSKARVIIENAFALLKGRFRRLKYLETVRLDLIALLIVAACILHNVCILKKDFLTGIINLEEELQIERAHNPHNREDIDDNERSRLAQIKRSNICNSIRIINA